MPRWNRESRKWELVGDEKIGGVDEVTWEIMRVPPGRNLVPVHLLGVLFCMVCHARFQSEPPCYDRCPACTQKKMKQVIKDGQMSPDVPAGTFGQRWEPYRGIKPLWQYLEGRLSDDEEREGAA